MIFNSRISKVGKAKNISVFMPNKNEIYMYYFSDGIFLKTIEFQNDNTILNKKNTSLAFNEVIQIDNNHLLARIGKSMEIVSVEK